MLLHVPELLNAKELAHARGLLGRRHWVDGRETAGPQAASVKNNEQLKADSEEARALQTLVLDAMQRSTLLFSAALPKRVLPPFFNRYAGAGPHGSPHDNPHDNPHYGDHVDQAIRYHQGQALRSDISCTVFISDPASYDGGELVIHGSFGDQRCKLPAGDAVIYPGSSVHRVEPVTRGTRLASFFWIESLVRSDAQRTLLHDMDMALMRLRERERERDGESAEAVALTGVYHNLLRQWSDT